MAEIQVVQFEEVIFASFDECLLKMSLHLSNTFDPALKESLLLFKQFCSAINARRQWLKSVKTDDGQSGAKLERMQKMLEKKPYKDFAPQTGSGKTWLETALSKPNPNHPIKPEHLQSGLVCKR